MKFDVAIIGLGGMGSAILAHCAARGARVIGLEQFEPDHKRGSSTGRSRLIRKAYFEDPAYVPLLLRAYDLWHELERAADEEILTITGLLLVGEESSPVIIGARRAAAEHLLALEVLEPREIAARYPELRVLPHEIGVFEPDGGVLVPERAIAAHLRVAAEASAETRFGNAVVSWTPRGPDFEVTLADGTRVIANALVLAQGPWLGQALELPLRVQRNVQAWFAPATDAYAAGRFPPFLLERAGLPAPLYGFPDFGDGIKAAFHSHGEWTDAEKLDRAIDPARDIDPIVAAMESWMPGATRRFLDAKPCPYTLTPDGHFVVDRHPRYERVIICGGFSGHGFKFAPVIGEIAADLALEGVTRHEIEFLSHRRFARGIAPH